MSDGSWSFRIACTRPFRYRRPPQTQMSCRLHESHGSRTDTGEDRVMVVVLARHKPCGYMCLFTNSIVLLKNLVPSDLLFSNARQILLDFRRPVHQYALHQPIEVAFSRAKRLCSRLVMNNLLQQADQRCLPVANRFDNLSRARGEAPIAPQ